MSTFPNRPESTTDSAGIRPERRIGGDVFERRGDAEPQRFTDANACTVGNGLVICPQETSTEVIASHLGHSSATATGTATLDFTEPACTNPAGESGTVLVAQQDMVIVAADGSELHAHTVATACFVDFGHPSDATGTYTITGGTGRFADATGNGQIDANVADLKLTSSWTGTIAY